MTNPYTTFDNSSFEEDVLVGQMVSGADRTNRGTLRANNKFYQTDLDQIGHMRRDRVHALGLELIHPEFLAPLADWFFERLDEDRFLNDAIAVGRFLMFAELAFRLIHFTKDGTGRAGEDLMIYLAKQAGIQLTYSATGYREAVDGSERPLFFRKAAERIFHRELVSRCYAYAGFAPAPDFQVEVQHIAAAFRREPSLTPSQCWPDELVEQIDDMFSDLSTRENIVDEILAPGRPYRVYADFLVKEVIYFLLCMDDPAARHEDFVERYRLFGTMYPIDHAGACARNYTVTPPDIGEHCDSIVAGLDTLKIRPDTKNLRVRLERDVGEVAKDFPAIGRLLADELEHGPANATLAKLRLELDSGANGEALRDELARALNLPK